MSGLEKKAYQGLGQFIIALFLFLFLPAGTLHFSQAWLYWFVFSFSCLLITVYFLKYDKKLIERRLNVGPGAEKETSQKIIQAITGLTFVAMMLFPGIDHRFMWSSLPPMISIVAEVFVALGFYIIFLVFKENSFTSAIIETDKEQKVISTGPYHLVRHPMYAGALLLFFATPFALGSSWMLVFSVLLTIMMIIRLLEEEKFLVKNLKGYADYRHKTRYRLIPFIW